MGSPLLDAFIQKYIRLIRDFQTKQVGGEPQHTVQSGQRSKGFMFSAQPLFPEEVGQFAGVSIALWGRDDTDTRIYGWDESGAQVVDIDWPDADPPKDIVESSDGFIYSVHGTTVATNKIKRWKIEAGVVTGLETLVSGAGIPAGIRFGSSIFTGMGERILVDTSGNVYVRGVEDTKKIQMHWYKLVSGTPWTLVLEQTNPFGIEEWLRFVLGSDGGAGCGTADEYCTRLAIATMGVSTLEKPSREFVPVVLPSGRWVAADPLFNFLAHHVEGTFGGWYVTGTEQSALVWYGNPTFPDEFAAVAYRAWGDAWFERTVGAWSAVVNGGVASTARNLATTNAPQSLVEDSGGGEGTGITPNFSPVWKLQENGNLPVVLGRWGGFLNETDTPLQQFMAMRSDATHLFLWITGGTDDVSGDFKPGGLYKSTIPAAGAAPTFALILAEPDFDDVPQRQWRDVDVTDTRLWIVEYEYAPDVTRIVSYAKDGTGRQVHQTISGIKELSLETAWGARWQ